MNRLSFLTQFKIEFLLPFTSCRKVLGKIPAWADLSHKNGKIFDFFGQFFLFSFHRRRQSSEVFCQKGILRNFTKIFRKTSVPEFHSNIVAEGLQLFEKDTGAQVFSYGLCKILKNKHFVKHLQATLAQSHFNNQSLYKNIFFNLKHFITVFIDVY